MLLILGSLTKCGYRGNKSGLHWFLDMHDSLAVEAQEEDTTTLNYTKEGDWYHGADLNSIAWGGPGSAMRVPPEGTVPRNYQPYPYGPTDFDKAAQELKNPLPRTQSVLERGKKEFEIYCYVCHGYRGQGDGPVVPPFPKPPNLITGAAKFQPDGWTFHMITMGRGAMKSYAAQISVADRWAIIHYLRLLQQNGEN